MTVPSNLAELDIDELKEIAKYLEFYKNQQSNSNKGTSCEIIDDTSLLAVCRANYLAKKNCFQMKEEIRRKKQCEDREYIYNNISAFTSKGKVLEKIYQELKEHEGTLKRINGYSFTIHSLERTARGKIAFVFIFNEKSNVSVMIKDDLSIETQPCFANLSLSNSLENWEELIISLCKVIESP
ncbi:DgyrCDS9752 [Dimorphilus gyrociliatus]|uniref:DgyrCDS9752 n=1 Tax=Dimorphilus gyrociliatus TaxID=2664684 RepID=A0A7I8W0M2_9ANNE|nr:DgyrCDS9752 [Dimorphilus gyrociliatus]